MGSIAETVQSCDSNLKHVHLNWSELIVLVERNEKNSYWVYDIEVLRGFRTYYIKTFYLIISVEYPCKNNKTIFKFLRGFNIL